jgi:hypothetical protein
MFSNHTNFSLLLWLSLSFFSQAAILTDFSGGGLYDATSFREGDEGSLRNGYYHLLNAGSGSQGNYVSFPVSENTRGWSDAQFSMDFRASDIDADGWSVAFLDTSIHGESGAVKAGSDEGLSDVEERGQYTNSIGVGFRTFNGTNATINYDGLESGDASYFLQPSQWGSLEIKMNRNGTGGVFVDVSIFPERGLRGNRQVVYNQYALQNVSLEEFRVQIAGRTGGASMDLDIDNVSLNVEIAEPPAPIGIVINEFVANNGDSLEDEDLDSADWIELYNGQDQNQDLSGYYLTNDPTQKTLWQIPRMIMSPFDHLVIFASGKDRSSADSSLHTNFNLSKEGGYLALIAPDGTTVVSEFDYLEQAQDISYGALGVNRSVGYLENPSPGAINFGLQADGPPAESVKFDRAGGAFSGSAALAILPPASPTAVVRYTTNGSIPNTTSRIYSSRFNITDTTTIRARVYEQGRLPGDIKSRTFLELASNIRNFTSNLPIVVVDTNGVNIDSSGRSFQPVYTVVIDRDELTGIARINDPEPDFTGRGGMHIRGQSSAGFPKKQYAWETWNNENEDKKVSVLGMPAESDWILYAPYSDKTLMRNAIVYETARTTGGSFGGVRTQYVEVFMNRNQGTVTLNDYRGVYVLMEKIKRGKERVDIERLGSLTKDPKLITGGYIFKKDKGPYSRAWNTSIERVPLDMHEPERPNSAQFSYIRNYVNQMETALHGDSFDDPDEGYQAYIDRLSFIDSHLYTEAFKDIDGYRISTYFSKSRNGKIRALPVWDFNLGLGNANYLNGQNPRGWYYPQVGGSDYYWYDTLFTDKEFTLAYWDRFWFLRRSLLSTRNMMGMIDRHDAELDGSSGTPNAVTRNFQEWNTLGRYLWPNADGFASRRTHQAEVDWMKNWLTTRLAWMETQSRGSNGNAKPPVFNSYGGEVQSGFDLAMGEPNNWAGAKIYYTLDGSDPRLGKSPSIALIEENAPCEVLVPSAINGGSSLTIGEWTNVTPPPNLASWTSGKQGVGYEKSSSNLYDDYFNLDIESQMASKNGSCYIRIPFTISSQAELDSLEGLTLKMRYDDSFVAFINGAEVAKDSNAPSDLAWDSIAEGSHDDDEAIEYVPYSISGGGNLLRVGENILAIQGLNRGRGSNDALWSCLLSASRGGGDAVSANALVYSSAINLDKSVDVRARSFDGFKWSPLSQAGFVVSAVPASVENLVISEIHYRPASPSSGETSVGFDSRGDFEFIELLNIDPDQAINLEGISFVDGIDFAGFDNSLPLRARILGPGERVLLVGNQAGFELRYGSANIAGEYDGSLRNEGEQIVLLDAGGFSIRDFTYGVEFPWPEAAGDGSGFSLVLNDAVSNPDHSQPTSWRASVDFNGTPGGDDSVLFTGVANADEDGDGFNAFLEYALGSDDGSSSSLPSLSLDREASDGLDDFFTVSFRVNLAAVGLQYSLQGSNDLISWTSEKEMTHVATDHNGDGTATMKFRSTSPVNAVFAERFYRIHVEGRE